MSQSLDELVNLLGQIVAAQKKLLAESDRHQAAVKTVNVAEMEASRRRHESLAIDISSLENRRRSLMQQLGAAHKMSAPTITRLAEFYPQYRVKLLVKRDELRAVIEQISQRTNVTGKIAGAVLGHLNTVVRLLAGAMQQAGVYTHRGVPRVAPRIGMIEAVG